MAGICKINKQGYAVVILILLFSIRSKAQPYLDVINLRYANSPNAGIINQNKNEVKIQYFNFSTNIPLQFNHKKDAVIFSPFIEKWSSQINQYKQQDYYGLALPVSLSKTIPHSKWNILLTGIVRINDRCIHNKSKWQVGGAFIAAYKKSEKLTYKAGLYVNNDLFGVFAMPLLGIDWNINRKDNLFGILPGNLTYEHKLNKHLYYGAAFRAITNSYQIANAYWRIDENQLGLYLDTYLNKNIVLNIEGGHSVLRKIRTGFPAHWDPKLRIPRGQVVAAASIVSPKY